MKDEQERRRMRCDGRRRGGRCTSARGACERWGATALETLRQESRLVLEPGTDALPRGVNQILNVMVNGVLMPH